MEDNATIYNVQYLSQYTSLNTVEGLKRCGDSRLAYFEKLADFEKKAAALHINLTEVRLKNETLTDLITLQALLLDVCETQIIEQVEDLMLTVKRGKVKKDVGDGLYTVSTNLTRLCQRINAAIVNPNENIPAVPPPAIPDTVEAPSEPDTLPIAEKMKVPVSKSLFSKLSALINEFDFKKATEEVKSLMEFSFDDEIDAVITGIHRTLEKSDFKTAKTRVQHLLTLAGEKENPLLNEASASTASAKKTILAIDDMPDILASIKNMLRSKFNVYCVPNHLAALKFLSGNIPDLILLDIEMPDMDGFSLLKLLRKMDECKDIPVIFLTGNVSIENIKESVSSGGNDFIKKPVEYDLLMSKINRHLGITGK